MFAPLLALAVTARSLRRAGGSVTTTPWRTLGFRSSTKPFSPSTSAADLPPIAADDAERAAAEASLYETGELNPRDYGYAHPSLVVKDDGGDGGGKRLAVSEQTQQRVPLGSTLLLARPLVFLDAPEDHQPPPEALVNAIAMKRLWQTPAAAALQWDAPPPRFAAAAAQPSPPRPRAPPPPLADLAALPPHLRSPAPLDDAAANEAEPDAAATVLVAVNAFGDEYEDLPSSRLRLQRRARPEVTSPIASSSPAAGSAGGIAVGDHSGGPRALAGVWPAFSLLNHSCAPTCAHYVVGSTMVVRAAADLSPGDEASVSYLGREAFGPAAERRRALQERYGFTCACARCRAEDALPEAVRESAAAARRAVVERLRPRFEAAVRDGDGAAAAEVAGEVSALLAELERVLEKELAASSSSPSRGGGGGGADEEAPSPSTSPDGLAAQAIAYEAYELLYFASALAEAAIGAGLENELEEDDDGGGTTPAQLAEGESAEDRGRRALAHRGARHSATSALARCALILDGVARGSEVHVLSAHALMRRATQQQRRAAAAAAARGGGGQQQQQQQQQQEAAERMAAAAAAIVAGAHEARYGASRLPEGVALELLEASKALADEYF